LKPATIVSSAFAATFLAAVAAAQTSAPPPASTPPGPVLSPTSPVVAVPARTVPKAVPGDPVTSNPRVAPIPPEIPIALLVDLSSGQTLFAREPHRRFVPASVTKVMTAYSIFRLIGEGKLKEDRPVIVTKEVAEIWSGEGSSMFIQAGDRLTVAELLLGVTTVSGNDAAAMLAVTTAGSLDAWLDVMNANAAELGLRDTHFGTPNGWPDEGRTYTSARDLAILAEAMTTRYPDLYRRYIGHSGLRYRNIAQNNHDPVTGQVEGADGIKTGYTRQAGYTFIGSAERNGRRLVVAIGGAPSSAARNHAARNLLNWGFEAFGSRTILPAGAEVGEALVQNGSSGGVALRTASPVLASFPRGSDPTDVSLAIRYRGPLEAPIAAGRPSAYLRVSVPGQRPHEVPLVAAEDVPEANPFQRLRNGLTGLFW
jgi:D-alanyl-D-alanine carboxypeptidase (penicillin-binding protein 5/6)